MPSTFCLHRDVLYINALLFDVRMTDRRLAMRGQHEFEKSNNSSDAVRILYFQAGLSILQFNTSNILILRPIQYIMRNTYR